MAKARILNKLTWSLTKLITARQRSCGQVMFSQVCLSTGGKSPCSHTCPQPRMPPNHTHPPQPYTPLAMHAPHRPRMPLPTTYGWYASNWNVVLLNLAILFLHTLYFNTPLKSRFWFLCCEKKNLGYEELANCIFSRLCKLFELFKIPCSFIARTPIVYLSHWVLQTCDLYSKTR